MQQSADKFLWRRVEWGRRDGAADDDPEVDRRFVVLLRQGEVVLEPA